MTTISSLRRLAEDCRRDREKVVLDPDVLDALLDQVPWPDAADLTPRGSQR